MCLQPLRIARHFDNVSLIRHTGTAQGMLQLMLLRDAVSPVLRKRTFRLMRHSGGFWISNVFLE